MIRKQWLTRIAPLRAGNILGTLYAILGIVLAPIILVSTLEDLDDPTKAGFAVGLGLGIPVFYGVLGFIGGCISAWLYNLVASWTGGLEFEVTDNSDAD